MISEVSIVEPLYLFGPCTMNVMHDGKSTTVVLPPSKNRIKSRETVAAGLILECEHRHGLFVSCLCKGKRGWRAAETARLFVQPGCELLPEDLEYVNDTSFLVLSRCAYNKRIEEASSSRLLCECAETPRTLARSLRDRLPSDISVSVDAENVGIDVHASSMTEIQGPLAEQLRLRRDPQLRSRYRWRGIFPLCVLQCDAKNSVELCEVIAHRTRFCTVTKPFIMGRLMGHNWYLDLNLSPGKYDGATLCKVCAQQCESKDVTFEFSDECLRIRSTGKSSRLSFQAPPEPSGPFGPPPLFVCCAADLICVPIHIGGSKQRVLPRIGHNVRAEGPSLAVGWGETRLPDSSIYQTAAPRDVPWMSLSGDKGSVYTLEAKRPTKKPVVSGCWPTLEIASFHVQGRKGFITKKENAGTTIIFLDK
jgi:hypothetical protein